MASHDVASLLPAAAALCHLLSPLSFSGVFIPFLPAALHPEPETLVNHTPTPFVIGVEAQTLPLLQPLAEHVLLLDLDAATLTVWVNGERKGVMVRPGMTGSAGQPVGRLEGPLRWAVDLERGSVAISGPLPPAA